MAQAPRSGALLGGDDVLEAYRLNSALRKSARPTSREEWAKALLQQGSAGTPVGSPLEGLAKMLTAGVGGYIGGEERRAGEQSEAQMLADMMGRKSQQQAEEQRQLAGAGVPGFSQPPAPVEPGVARAVPTAMGGVEAVPQGFDAPPTRAPANVDAALIQAVAAMQAGGNKTAGSALPGLQFAYGDIRDKEREAKADAREAARDARAAAAASREPEQLRILRGLGIDPTSPQARELLFPKSVAGADAGKTGLVPVYGTDEAGKLVALFPDGKGGFKQADTGGIRLLPQTQTLDLGTTKVTIDRNGNPVATHQVDIAGREREKEVGEAAGKALVSAPQAVRTAEQTTALIDSLLQHPALRMGTGGTGILLNRVPGTPTYDFGQRVEQLQGRAFLEAFESLKGGGQITEVEGRKATQAIARLNAAQSETAFREALTELRDIAASAGQRAAARIPAGSIPGPGGVGTATPPPAPVTAAPVRVNSPDEARRLPSGTPIILPDGTQGRVP